MYRQIIKSFMGVAMLLSMLVCIACSFKAHDAKVISCKSIDPQISSCTTPFEGALLGNYPVTVPAPYLSNYRNGSFVKGFSNKFFNQVFFGDCYSDISFFNFSVKETVECILQPLQLHLTFCVLRI